MTVKLLEKFSRRKLPNLSQSLFLFVCLSAKFVFGALVLFDWTIKNIMVVVAWTGWTTVDYFCHHIKSIFRGLPILIVLVQKNAKKT